MRRRIQRLLSGSKSVAIVGMLLLVVGVTGCALDSKFAGYRVTNKEVETGSERVAIRVLTCVDPKGFVVCERRYGALTECSVMCKPPKDRWIERPAGYGGYEDREFTRYLITLQSPSGATERLVTTKDQYAQLSVGQVIGAAPTAPSSEPDAGARDAGGRDVTSSGLAPATTPSPEAQAPAEPAVVMTVADAQRRLAELGFDPGPADGVSGARTQRALRAFQTSRGIAATGQLDAATMVELKR